MKAALASIIALLLMHSEARAQVDPVTGMAFVKALGTYVANCATASDQEEYQRRGCFGTGFEVAPKVKRLWALRYKWRKQCGDIAEMYCLRMGLDKSCPEGVRKLHSGSHPECYLSDPYNASIEKHCGDIAERYCVNSGLSPACPQGVAQLRSGNHEECDLLRSVQEMP